MYKIKNILCARVVGGLGNQLFIYAFARVFALKNKYQLVFDIKTGFVNDNYGRSPKLNRYISGFNEASRMLIYVFYLTKIFPRLCALFLRSEIVTEADSRSFFDLNTRKFTDNSMLFIQGYFQSYKYLVGFEDQIRRDINLTFPKTASIEKFETEISISNSVSIHVRRLQYDNVLDLSYYMNAIQLIKASVKNPSFFIFSDDIEWCKNNFPGTESLTYVTHDVTDEVADLWLMSCCKNHIIANSSFSWWGAWLSGNKDKIVFAPENTDIGVKENLYPESWIVT